MNAPMNLIKTRTTRYMAEDGKERAVLLHEDYEQLLSAVVQFTQLANSAAIMYSETGAAHGRLGGAFESARALLNMELESSKPFLE